MAAWPAVPLASLDPLELPRLVCAAGLALLLLKLLRVLAWVASFVWAHFLRPSQDPRRYGAWAVVTGCTDGIGRAYASELARKGAPAGHGPGRTRWCRRLGAVAVAAPLSARWASQCARQPSPATFFLAGLNLVLISRCKAKLEACAAELQQRHGVATRVIAADLCAADAAAYRRVAATLEGLDVGLLVNNAGLSYDHSEYLADLEDELVPALLAVNAAAPTLVRSGARRAPGARHPFAPFCRWRRQPGASCCAPAPPPQLAKLVLPGMLRRRRGLIVNLGSGVTALPASPMLSVYAGTKAYIDFWSQSLGWELRRSGVQVQCQVPMFVATKMAKLR